MGSSRPDLGLDWIKGIAMQVFLNSPAGPTLTETLEENAKQIPRIEGVSTYAGVRWNIFLLRNTRLPNFSDHIHHCYSEFDAITEVLGNQSPDFP